MPSDAAETAPDINRHNRSRSEACEEILQTERDAVAGRRRVLRTAGAALGAAMLAPQLARAQGANRQPLGPPSTITQPPRDFSPNGAPTTYFTDPDVLTVDPAFDGLRQPNAAIQRLWTGALWSEGPAWNSVGKFLVWSDIPNNRQMRYLEDDGHVSVFRAPSNNSNGNTFDFQGRQLSCEHLTRRVVRYELDGSATIIASMFNGKRLNSPNDVVSASGRQLLVHRPAVRRAVLRRHRRRRRRPGQQGRAPESPPRPAARSRQLQARAADRGVPRRQGRRDDAGRGRGPGARPERPVLLARLQEDVHRQHRPRPRRHDRRRQGRHVPSTTSAPTTSSRTASCSATSWSTA